MMKIAAALVLLTACLVTGCTTHRVESSPLGAPPTDSDLRPPNDSGPRPYIDRVTDPARQPSPGGGIRY